MATNSKFGGKQRPPRSPTVAASAKPSESIADEVGDVDAAPQTPQVSEAAIEAAAEPLVIGPTAIIDAEPFSRSEEATRASFDPGALALKSFELWSENANALLDFTEELTKAKTLSDVIALQSRFASERYDSLVKHAAEFAEATRRLATQAGASLPQGFVAVYTS